MVKRMSTTVLPNTKGNSFFRTCLLNGALLVMWNATLRMEMVLPVGNLKSSEIGDSSDKSIFKARVSSLSRMSLLPLLLSNLGRLSSFTQ